jgi:hypothetical protein
MSTKRHKQALEEEQREAKREAWRHRVRINIARTSLQTLREGASYVQIEHKLHILHLDGVDIGSMNHSREFILGFVESMTVVMDRRTREHVRATDPMNGRKQVIACMADKVTELHPTGDKVTEHRRPLVNFVSKIVNKLMQCVSKFTFMYAKNGGG